MRKPREILTTGEVARICKVAPRTVSKWVDTGQLRGYRIPGSRDRRIPLQHLIRFMRVHGMPLEDLDTGESRVLVVDLDRDLCELIRRAMNATGRFQVRTASSAVETGALMEQFQPQVVLADIDVHGIDGRDLARFVAARSELAGTHLIAMSASLTPADRQMFLQQGFHDTIAKPFDIHQLTEAVEAALGILV
ncbi:MAG TPA: response regulator [Phycisphaerae bacterium]|nr:response regulator [Phycisphaerae bacterium]